MQSNRLAVVISLVSLAVACVAFARVTSVKPTVKPAGHPTFDGVTVDGILEAKTIVVERIHVKDSEGRYVVAIGVDSDGGGSLRIRDVEGEESAALKGKSREGNAFFYLGGGGTRTATMLQVHSDGQGSLILYADDPEDTVMLGPFFESNRRISADPPPLPEDLPEQLED